MKRILLALAFLASTVWAAPSVQSSQFTAFTNTSSAVVAIQPGAAGERIFVFVAAQETTRFTLPSGWKQLANEWSGVAQFLIYRLSDGTEASVTIPLSIVASGEALVVRVAGPFLMTTPNPLQPISQPVPPVVSASISGGNVSGDPATPDAPNYTMSAHPTLHLTFAVTWTPHDATPVLAPSGYSNILFGSNAYAYQGGSEQVNVGIMVSERLDADGGPENAGPWLLAAAAIWRAQTVGIR